MKKLELKDICGYFPHNINFLINNIFGVNAVSIGQFAQGIEYDNRMVSISWIYRNINNGLKPILRPMSDLFKRIKVDGYNDSKEFIPIEKVSEILDLDGYQGLYTTFVVDNNKISFFIFGEWIADFTLFLDILDNKKNCSVHISFMQSIKILDLLNKCHFDYRGLIGKELAVDVNGIHGNP